jgi:RNA-directed DNA polymerase
VEQVDEAQAYEGAACGRGDGRNPGPAVAGAEASTVGDGQSNAEGLRLMEAVVERSNLRLAYRRVVGNKGAAGIDGLTVTAFADCLKLHWPSVKAALLEGRYLPQAVRAVDIPKPQGGVRTLGIPTVLDRLIQQALLQILQPMFEPGFSESSYGYRPSRSASQAVQAARQHVSAGRRWVVELDLERFFDTVNHDVLMDRVERRVKDRRVLKLIRRYLEAGLMRDGIVQWRGEGTPQGGPLSPLLSNILLTDLDRELTRRGHAFCRYADDCNIYVRSEAAAHHALEQMTVFLEQRLRLKVNRAKSAVARPWERKFLGYSLTWHRDARLRIAPTSLQRLKDAIRGTMREGRGRSLAATVANLNPKLRGWLAYFRHTEVKGVLQDLDGWIRRKLRSLLWRQGKRPYARAKALMRRGLTEGRAWRSATNGRGPWWNAGASHMSAAYPKAFFDSLGLVSLVDAHQRFLRHS